MKTQNKLCCISKAMSIHFPHNIRIRLAQLKKQDSKELSPRPLENAPKTFNSKTR